MAALLTVLPLLLTACATRSDLPPWFDGIHRYPIRSIQVAQHRVAYLDLGQGAPVIFIHGLAGSMWQWEYQQDALAAHHRVITLDILGSGLSDKPSIDYTPETMVEWFVQFMDALGIQRASLVGNSLGAGLASAMAVAHPARVDRLVLIGGLPPNVRQHLTSPLLRQAIDTDLPVWLINLGNLFTGRGTTRKLLEELVYDHRLLTDAVIDRSSRNRSRPGLINPAMSMVRNLPLWEQGYATRLADIRQPTLIVWGAEDRVFPPSAGEDLHRRVPTSSLSLIPGAGHLPQWEQPRLVNPLLLRFLQP